MQKQAAFRECITGPIILCPPGMSKLQGFGFFESGPVFDAQGEPEYDRDVLANGGSRHLGLYPFFCLPVSG